MNYSISKDFITVDGNSYSMNELLTKHYIPITCNNNENNLQMDPLGTSNYSGILLNPISGEISLIIDGNGIQLNQCDSNCSLNLENVASN